MAIGDTAANADEGATMDALDGGPLGLLVRHRARIAKSACGAALLCLGAWLVQRHVISTISEEAVLTTDFVDLTAPIEGFVRYNFVAAGAVFNPSQIIGTIENPLLDRSTADDLQARLRSLDGNVNALTSVESILSSLGSTFETRGKNYQRRRADQLRILLAETRSRADADQARMEEARTRLKRVQSMSEFGLLSAQGAEEARRDATVAEKISAASEHEYENVKASIDGLSDGFTLGEYSSADKSYSGQRGDEIRLRLAQIRGDLAEKRAQREALAVQLEAQRARLSSLLRVELKIPRRTGVFGIYAADGVYVPRGTLLLRLMDCSHLRVLAYMAERQYDRIRIGDPADILVAPGKRHFTGHVDLRLGSSDALLPVGTASQLPPPQRQRFVVVVSSPELTAEFGQRCDMGHNVEVRFLRPRS
jgi:multidrug resistance efflux pump